MPKYRTKEIIKGSEIVTPKTRKTAVDYGFYGSPVTRIIPAKKGKGYKYNRAKEKRKSCDLEL